MEKEEKTSDANLLPLMAIFGIIFLVMGLSVINLSFMEQYGKPSFSFDKFIWGLINIAWGALLFYFWVKDKIKKYRINKLVKSNPDKLCNKCGAQWK